MHFPLCNLQIYTPVLPKSTKNITIMQQKSGLGRLEAQVLSCSLQRFGRQDGFKRPTTAHKRPQ